MSDQSEVGMNVEISKSSAVNATYPPKLSKAVKKANKIVQRHYDEVNVLVTGFGSINHRADPDISWLVAKSLPPALPANEAHPTRIRIVSHPEPIAANYNNILAATPRIFNTYPPFDLVLHLASAAYGAHYSLQQVACRADYTVPDAIGASVDVLKQPAYWNECDDMLRSSVAPKDVVTRWRSDAPSTTDLRTSTTTKHFLCDYQFYASLAHVQHQSRNKHLDWNERTTVASLCMPNGYTFGEDLESAKKVVISLIYALVDSRRFRGSDYDDVDMKVEQD